MYLNFLINIKGYFMSKKEIIVVILAGGKGSRMKSKYPKVLHVLGGKTILEHVVETAKSVKPKKIIIVYSDKKLILSKFDNIPIQWVMPVSYTHLTLPTTR
jgi:bifunctional UDP-N-acetylglucosamine pyrophosphorylase/glucosamine-1-phosphate N-acetyltransferase